MDEANKPLPGASKSSESRPNSQMVNPPENVFAKPGNVKPVPQDWVPPITCAAEWKPWREKFWDSSCYYIQTCFFQNQEMMDLFFKSAVRKGAELGKFKKMDELITLHGKTHSGKALLDRLEKEFCPSTETDRRRATDQFLAFKRGAMTLLQASTALGQVVLKCRDLGYEPGNDTLEAKYMSLLVDSERPFIGLYIDIAKSKDPENKLSSYDKALWAIEQLARSQRDHGLQGGGTTSTSLAADGTGGRGGRGGRRGRGGRGGGPRRETYEAGGAGRGKKCGNCGYEDCKGGDQCRAANKKCKHCDKIGHFKAMCRSKAKDEKAAMAEGEAVYPFQ